MPTPARPPSTSPPRPGTGGRPGRRSAIRRSGMMSPSRSASNALVPPPMPPAFAWRPVWRPRAWPSRAWPSRAWPRRASGLGRFRLGRVGLGGGRPLGEAVGHHHDHRQELLLGVEVVEDHVGRALLDPASLVVAGAVEEVEDRVLGVLGVARRRVDEHLPLAADRFGIVLDRLDLAPLDAVAPGVEAPRRGGEFIGRVRTRRKGYAAKTTIVPASPPVSMQGFVSSPCLPRKEDCMKHPPALRAAGFRVAAQFPPMILPAATGRVKHLRGLPNSMSARVPSVDSRIE